MTKRIAKRDLLPWAAPFTGGPVGRILTGAEAASALGWAYDQRACYVAADGGVVRRVIATEDEARANGIAFIFTGLACDNGHVEPRKLRASGATPVCVSCDRVRKRRAAVRSTRTTKI